MCALCKKMFIFVNNATGVMHFLVNGKNVTANLCWSCAPIVFDRLLEMGLEPDPGRTGDPVVVEGEDAKASEAGGAAGVEER